MLKQDSGFGGTEPPELDPSGVRRGPRWTVRFTMGFRMFAALLLCLLVAYYFPFLTGARSFYQSDLTYYFEPFCRFIAEAFREGRLPLWNPYLYCGMAQAAVPSPGMFYPPTAIFMFGRFSQAVAAYLVAHQLLAGCGAYLLVASFGWGVLAASVCGLAVALTGYMFSLTANYTLVATIAWLPLLLFFIRSIDRTWTRGNVLKIFGGSVCMFSMIAAGRPETFAPAALLVVAYVVVTAFGEYRDDRMPRPAIEQAGLRLLSIAGGCIMALPVILPAIEWVRLSPRSNGLDLKWVLMWSANWYDCLGLVSSQPLGDITVLGSRFLNLVASRRDALPYLTSTYVGPVVLTLALWSLWDRNWRWRVAVIAVLVCALLMALGHYTPVAPFVCKLSPAFAAFRYPVKLMIFPIMCLALMAARGASLAINREVRPVAEVTTAVLWGLFGLLGTVFMIAPQLSLLTAHFPWFHGRIVDFGLMRESQMLFGKSFLITGALGLLVSANYLAYQRDQFTKEIFAFLTGGTLILTLMMPAFAYQRHGTAGDFYERSHPLVERLQQLTKGTGGQLYGARVQTLYHDPLTLTNEFMQRQRMGFQQGFYLYTRELALPNTNVDWHIPYSFGYEASEDGFYKKLRMDVMATSSQNLIRPEDVAISDAPSARFCAMTSTRYCLTQCEISEEHKPVEKLDESLFKLIEDNPRVNYRIYETRAVLPRAYFANAIEWNASRDEFRDEALNTKSKAPMSSTYVSGAAVDGIVDGAGASSNITFDSEQPERVELSATTDKPRLLVLTDHFYPGWIALLDGKLTEIRLVNFFARGIAVPPGRHKIVFAYNPLSVWLGLAATAAVFLAFALGILIAPGKIRTDHSP